MLFYSPLRVWNCVDGWNAKGSPFVFRRTYFFLVHSFVFCYWHDVLFDRFMIVGFKIHLWWRWIHKAINNFFPFSRSELNNWIHQLSCYDNLFFSSVQITIPNGGKDKKELMAVVCLFLSLSSAKFCFCSVISILRTRTFILSPHSICMSLVAIFDLHKQNELMQMSN